MEENIFEVDSVICHEDLLTAKDCLENKKDFPKAKDEDAQANEQDEAEENTITSKQIKDMIDALKKDIKELKKQGKEDEVEKLEGELEELKEQYDLVKADERKKTRQKIMAIIKKNSKLLVSGIMLGGSIGAILLNIPMVKLGADALYIFSMLGDASSWADAGNKLETFFRNLFTPATPEKA